MKILTFTTEVIASNSLDSLYMDTNQNYADIYTLEAKFYNFRMLNFYQNKIYKIKNKYNNRGFKNLIKFVHQSVVNHFLENLQNPFKGESLNFKGSNKCTSGVYYSIFDKYYRGITYLCPGMRSNMETQYVALNLLLPRLDMQERQMSIEVLYMIEKCMDTVYFFEKQYNCDTYLEYFDLINDNKAIKFMLNHLGIVNDDNYTRFSFDNYSKDNIIMKLILDKLLYLDTSLYENKDLYDKIIVEVINLYKYDNPTFVLFIINKYPYLRKYIIDLPEENLNSSIKFETQVSLICHNMKQARLFIKLQKAMILILSEKYSDIYLMILDKCIDDVTLTKKNLSLCTNNEVFIDILKSKKRIHLDMISKKDNIEKIDELYLCFINYIYLCNFHKRIQKNNLSIEIYNTLIQNYKYILCVIEGYIERLSNYQFTQENHNNLFNFLKNQTNIKNFDLKLINLFFLQRNLDNNQTDLLNKILILSQENVNFLSNASDNIQNIQINRNIILSNKEFLKTELNVVLTALNQNIFNFNYEDHNTDYVLDLFQNILLSNKLIKEIFKHSTHNSKVFVSEINNLFMPNNIFFNKEDLFQLIDINIDRLLETLNLNIQQNHHSYFLKLYSIYYGTIKKIKYYFNNFHLYFPQNNIENHQTIYNWINDNFIKNKFKLIKKKDLLILNTILKNDHINLIENIYLMSDNFIKKIASGTYLNENTNICLSEMSTEDSKQCKEEMIDVISDLPIISNIPIGIKRNYSEKQITQCQNNFFNDTNQINQNIKSNQQYS